MPSEQNVVPNTMHSALVLNRTPEAGARRTPDNALRRRQVEKILCWLTYDRNEHRFQDVQDDRMLFVGSSLPLSATAA